ncbi:RNA-binding domain-containing protein [Rozella allomycis CSF55]|uniref:RNA-binding domain-containing protein n=1 Tax=Rozella allomycis (strain CSF55) TaxID=988480 RepID=A0A075APG6_ROZAC|nr:hypothetical protein O9G_004796 [Rozella allomycis CSF55]RKP18894.1 RNA-binding domain-containing protein [Rozella allomycis CSF55]|eukprot:EPZ31994.1 hypothetical protein O9G_004796 [Rozella allomycis CSF55]
MAHLLNMSLDEVIEQNRKRKTQDNRGSDFSRRERRRDNRQDYHSRGDRNYPSFRVERRVRHERFERRPYRDNQRYDRGPRVQERTVVSIENLSHEVSEAELRDIFERTGPINRIKIDYDSAGRSNGSAEVHYKFKDDSYKAVTSFNNMTLAGLNIRVAAIKKEIPQRNNFRDNHRGFKRDRYARGPRYSGRKDENDRKPPKSAEELDADMEAYMSKNDVNGGTSNLPEGDAMDLGL